MPSPLPRRVVVAVDDNMVYALIVMLHSLKSSATKPFSVLIGYFQTKLSATHQKLIRACADSWGLSYELRELVPHPLFTERRHLTITTFSKFVIADQLAEPHLWIDIDTVARPGWDDMFSHIHDAPSRYSLVVAGKLEGPNTRFEGFNAGVLGWTNAPRKEWVPALASLPEKRFSSEQHLFNTLYRDSYLPVDVRFNFLSSWHTHSRELSQASIIHYSGPIKPWHLNRRHVASWHDINPSWAMWFQAEEAMLKSLAGTPLRRQVHALKRQALFSGRFHFGKGALAGAIMKMLAAVGPVGTPLVWLIRKRASR